MTKRLYLEDPYVTSFDADIIETRETEEGPAAIFEQTYFYPDSGGQPSDLGTIGGVPIVKVIEDDADHGSVDSAQGLDAGHCIINASLTRLHHE